MRRIVPLLAGLSVVAAAAAYALYWHEVADGLRRGLDPWAEARRAEGFEIAWQAAEIDGFPFQFRLRVTSVALHASRPVLYTAASDEILLSAAPWNLWRWRFSAPRGANVQAPTVFSGLAATALSGTLSQRDDMTEITLSAQDVIGRGAADAFAAETLEAKIDLPTRTPASDRDLDLALALSMSKVDLPSIRIPLAQRLDSLALQAALKGALPAAPLDRALAQWRDAGGTLDIVSAHAATGTTAIDISGTIALDAALQPMGALTATVVGADRIVDAVVAAGAVEARYAGFVKSVLHAISTPGATGADAAHVPLTLQDQRLYIGPAAIAALPHVTWQ